MIRPLCKFVWAALATLSLSSPALAQDFPSKPIKIVVASAAGGASDILSRQVAERMQAIYGQPVIVEARPGANGNLAAEYVAAAAPDGPSGSANARVRTLTGWPFR